MKLTVLSYADVSAENINSLRRAAETLGVEIQELEPHRLSLWLDGGHRRVLLDGRPFTPDAVLHRTVARLMGVIAPVLHTWAEGRTVVLNDPTSSLVSRDKLATARALSLASIPYVPSLGLFADSEVLLPSRDLIRVTKPALGLRGEDVHLHADTPAAQSFIRALRPSTSHMVAQPLMGLPGSDIRAYIVGGRCVGLMTRTAKRGEFRANIAQGGTGSTLSNTHPAAILAERAVTALGLDFAGVDIVDDHGLLRVLEVDAWAGFAALEQVTGVDIASKIIQLYLTELGSHRV